jgi:antitoxin (DNA-binding transcriptional repressor) of toxin-antitoxin stability system
MKNARISELRDGLSDYLARVRKGETVIVYDRDTPIARIEPIAGSESAGLPPWVIEAQRRGILSVPKRNTRATLPPPVRTRKPARLVEALIEERQSGR